MRPEQARLRWLVWQLIATGGGVLIVGLAGGWWLTKRVTQPIATISATAEAISASDLSQRISITTTESELGQLAEVLNTMFARLEAAFDQQMQFTADASHELRTSVSIILAQAELALSKERTAESYRDTIETCYRGTKRMKSLVDSLLILARIDARNLQLHQQRFDVHQMVEECVALLTQLADERHISIHLDMQPVTWVGDVGHMTQMLTNLLTNAINYNRHGGQVTVTLTQHADAHAIELTVADTGDGIAPADRLHIFDRFYRVDKARSRALGGSGLGLPICQHIVAAHGGTIRCNSTLNIGTTFIVLLPDIPDTTGADCVSEPNTP